MIVTSLKKHEDDIKTFWRFTIEVNAAGGVLKSMGWRYFPESHTLKQPSTPVGGSWVSSSSADKNARTSILRLVESQVEARELDAALGPHINGKRGEK